MSFSTQSRKKKTYVCKRIAVLYSNLHHSDLQDGHELLTFKQGPVLAKCLSRHGWRNLPPSPALLLLRLYHAEKFKSQITFQKPFLTIPSAYPKQSCIPSLCSRNTCAYFCDQNILWQALKTATCFYYWTGHPLKAGIIFLFNYVSLLPTYYLVCNKCSINVCLCQSMLCLSNRQLPSLPTSQGGAFWKDLHGRDERSS